MTSLVSPEDFAAYLGVDLADLNEDRVELLLELGSDLIRDELRQVIDYVANDDVTLIGPGGNVLLLPELPVWDVTVVEETRGTSTRTLLATDYRSELGHDGRTGLLRRLRGAAWPDRDAVRVVYSHGYNVDGSSEVDELPGTLKLILLRAVSRSYANPTGIRQRTIGRYSETMSGSGDAGFYLTAGDIHDLGGFYAGVRSGARS